MWVVTTVDVVGPIIDVWGPNVDVGELTIDVGGWPTIDVG